MTRTFAEFAEFLRTNPQLIVLEISLHPTDLEALRKAVPERIGGGFEWHGLRVFSHAWVPRGSVRFETSKVIDLEAVVAIMQKVLPSEG